MIVLDSNAVRCDGFGASCNATLLHGLSLVCGHPLALPRLVLDEDLANYRRSIQSYVGAGDTERVLAAVPTWLGRADVARGLSADMPTANTAVQYREEALRKVFRKVLPSPEGSSDEAHRREVNRIRPASSSGGEGRDVVVWLTALAAASEVAPHQLIFVSQDGTFRFEDTHRMHGELISEAPPNLRFLPTVKAVIDRLSCHADVDADDARSPDVLNAIARTVVDGNDDPNHDLRRDLWDWEPPGLPQHARTATVTPSLHQLRDVKARTVGMTRLTAIDAIYRLDLHWTDAEPAVLTVRLGILMRHEEDFIGPVRVLARSGLRLAS